MWLFHALWYIGLVLPRGLPRMLHNPCKSGTSAVVLLNMGIVYNNQYCSHNVLPQINTYMVLDTKLGTKEAKDKSMMFVL